MLWFNEHDAFAAQWLRNLYPQATVDERSIHDVQASDTLGYQRCHFFGGIGGWQYALELAGWPAERPVWTGSCPCQPFSAAGKRKGEADERHLWPEFFRLIRECRPPVILGEQVASKDGIGWLDGVFADLEGQGYACGAADIAAAGVSAPIKRQRLFWVGIAKNKQRYVATDLPDATKRNAITLGIGGSPGGLDSTFSNGRRARRDHDSGHVRKFVDSASDIGGMAGADASGREGKNLPVRQPRQEQTETEQRRLVAWDAWDVAHCRDGKARRVERGTFPLAPRIPKDLGRDEPELRSLAKRARANRTGRLRGYGNSIVPQVAAEFVRAVKSIL